MGLERVVPGSIKEEEEEEEEEEEPLFISVLSEDA
jgi:hypothetical protein